MTDFTNIFVRDPSATSGNVAVTDSAEIDFSLNNQNITASLKDGSIVESKLNTTINTSLDLADTSLQPEDIGVTVQAYSDILQNTTATFDVLDQTKLDLITISSPINLNTLDGSVTAAVNGMIYKGDWLGATTGVFPGGGVAQTGFFYYVAENVTLDGVVFNVGDNIVAIVDNASTTTYAGNWSRHDQTDAVSSVAGKVGNVTLVAADIQDFQAVVSTNTDVLANTTNRHAPVTVTDSSEIDFTLTGQNITASLINNSISSAKLDPTLTQLLTDASTAISSVNNLTYDYITATGSELIPGAIDLTTDVTGVLPQANGGNGTTLSTGSGAAVYQLSPEFLGIPIAPTAALDTNTDQIATTSFVQQANDNLLTSFRSNGTKYYVSKSGSDSNVGTSIAEPFLTVKYAVSQCSPGDSIEIEAGEYVEVCPIVVPRDVAIQGDSLRRTVIKPSVGTELFGIFKVDSGFYCDGITFSGHQSDDINVGFAVSFNQSADNTGIGASDTGVYILKSPYVRNCTSYTAEDDAGEGGSLSTGSTGGGLLVDGAACASNSPIRSMVVDSYTQVNLGGPGILVKNEGYAQLVSCFGTFCTYHVKCETGGQVNLSNSTTNFGDYGLVADGYSTTPIFNGTLANNASGQESPEVKPVVFNSTSNLITSVGHGIANNTKVTFNSTLGDLPNPITEGVIYYVINAAADTFQVSLTLGGAAVNILENGLGNYEVKLQGDTSIDVTGISVNRLDPTGSGNPGRPVAGMLMLVNHAVAGLTVYVVTGSIPILDGFSNVIGYTVSFYSPISGGLRENLTAGVNLDFRLRSQISTGAHNMEYVGAGTNYNALPWFGGVPIPGNQIGESNFGKVFYSTTDELGNFKVGEAFSVDGTTGSVTINTDQFNLSGLNFIGPFSRDGGFSTVGVQLKEISNNDSLISSTGSPDANTVPTQTAVINYVDNAIANQGTTYTNYFITTTNNTPTALTSNGDVIGATNLISCDVDTSLGIRADIVGRTQTGATVYYELKASIKRIGTNAPVLIDTPIISTNVEEAGILNTSLDIGFSSNNAYIEVTGLAATTIKWRANVVVTQVKWL